MVPSGGPFVCLRHTLGCASTPRKNERPVQRDQSWLLVDVRFPGDCADNPPGFSYERTDTEGALSTVGAGHTYRYSGH